MKLNPKKCTFEIEEGTFLGYKVNTEGIMVCLIKVGAILNLLSPKCLKDVQKLNGKLASLNRFLSKSVKKSLPFFKTLKKCTKKSDFHWTTKAKDAFKEIKKMIAKLPTLTAPMEKEELIVYLAAAREATKNISQGINLGGFHSGTSKRRPSRHAHGSERRTFRPVDAVHGWIILRRWFDVTNNEAEYEALIAGLRIAEQIGVKNLQTNVDSRLVANQVLVEELKEKSINEAEVLVVVEEEGDTWMTPIYNYLMEETLPAEKEKARAIRRKSGSRKIGV
ncbi:reverse transcriptase domain-containing protein [Tanacetum coccineum]